VEVCNFLIIVSKVSKEHNLNTNNEDEGINKALSKKKTTTNATSTHKFISNNSVPKIVKSKADVRVLVKTNKSEDSIDDLETISK